MLNKKHILIIDAILIGAVLISVFFLVGYSQPLVIAPFSEDANLLFTIPATDYVLIDDNSKFSSPKTVFIDESFTLEKGRYFVKFFDGTSSEVREITFEIDVEIELRRVDENQTGFFNIGETDLLINTYGTGSLVNTSLVYSGGNDE
ncbi:hypothetical protein FJZ21_00880 [Candidatus Pacearchaeota archaeon]|nr:hypothetical protein [Candidatus Pacearchaeota archaeon]